MERTIQIPASIITAVTTVLISVVLAGLIAWNNSRGLSGRVERAESEVAQATERMRTAEAELRTNREQIGQLLRDQQLRSDKDAEQQSTADSELRDMRAEVQMLRQAVFATRPAVRNNRR
jgi:capsule polysaccharide export protein KpsE/RkpR